MTPVGRPATNLPTSRSRTQTAPNRTNVQFAPASPSKSPHRSPLAPARPSIRPSQPSQRPSDHSAPPHTGSEAAVKLLKHSPRAPRLRGVAIASASAPEPKTRSFKVGIETEFYLRARGSQERGILLPFVKTFAKNYNHLIPPEHPRINEDLRLKSYAGGYRKWWLAREESLKFRDESLGLELISPILHASPGSNWRRDVEIMWGYINEHYKVTKDEACGTHIHIGQEPGFDLADIKRIAQAAIHFEPAYEVLVPPERRGNPYAKSIWLNSPSLSKKGLSPAASIAAIEAIPDATDLRYLLGLLQPINLADPYNSEDRAYCWNFLSLYTTYSVEFRKPPASLSADQALNWAEFALTFVQACVYGRLSIAKLQKFPPNVGGLRRFLSTYGNQPGVSQPARLEKLFRGTSPEASMEAQFVPDSRPIERSFPGESPMNSTDIMVMEGKNRTQRRLQEALRRAEELRRSIEPKNPG